MCGKNYPYIGWSLLEPNGDQDIEKWCEDNFGATRFRPVEYDAGTAIHSVWRPGLSTTSVLKEALAFNDQELYRASQALRLLVSDLDEILLFIEPDINHLNVYGHKSRELLIAACTEVENYFQHYMRLASATPLRGRYFTAKDYVRLQPKLFIDEFEIEMHAYPVVGTFSPFENWNSSNFVLPWYDAYNKTKHHRDSEFHQATLAHCIYAVGACLVLFSIRFGPLWWQSNFVNSPIPDACRLFRQISYSGDASKVYIPKLDPPAGEFSSKVWGDLGGYAKEWTTIPFSL